MFRVSSSSDDLIRQTQDYLGHHNHFEEEEAHRIFLQIKKKERRSWSKGANLLWDHCHMVVPRLSVRNNKE